MNPAEHKFLAYFDNTFELTIRLQDENGTAIPASTFDTIEHSIYTSANEINPIVSNDLNDGITVTEGNILSFSITAEENKTLFGDVLYHKLVLSSSGGRETYISGRYIVQNNSGSQNDGDYTLVVNQDNLDISLTLTEASVSTALALEAKNDAQAIKDSLEWKGVYDPNETYTKDHRVSYEGSSYISLQNGNTGNTPVGNEADLFWDLIAESGIDGDTVIINSSGNWEISGTDTGVQAEGVDGVGIESIVLHATSGLDKTYRITFTDATTFDFVVSDGVDGDSAFVYIAYADDDTGTGFTTTFDASKDYIAVLSSTTEITPTASDFTGLWKNYKGAQGDGIGTHETTVGNHDDVTLGTKTEGRGLLFDAQGNLIESADTLATSQEVDDKASLSVKNHIITNTNYAIFYDDFERPDGALGDSRSGHTYETLFGDFSISGNKASASEKSASVVSIPVLQANNGGIKFDLLATCMSSDERGSGGIVAQDENNYFAFHIGENFAKTRKMIDGVETIISSNSFDQRIRNNGLDIYCYVWRDVNIKIVFSSLNRILFQDVDLAGLNFQKIGIYNNALNNSVKNIIVTTMDRS